MEDSILKYLNDNGKIEDSVEYAHANNWPHLELAGCLKSLASDFYVDLAQFDTKSWKLSKDGLEYTEKGTPEKRLHSYIPAEGITKDELLKNEEAKKVYDLGWIFGMKKKLFKLDAGVIKRNSEVVEDTDALLLQQIAAGAELDKKIIEELRKRKTIENEVVVHYTVTKGKSFSVQRKKKATDLTHDMLAKGTWKEESFKPYNFKALGKEIDSGNLHPLLKARAQFVEILLEMGFEEMPTNQYVESSFWNFDTLFQPQQHPARDAHDTFFVKVPEKAKIPDIEYWNKVKETHEKGGYGSLGWRYDWSEEEAKKNIFRTHTTGVSAKMLYNLGKEKEFKPKKYFSIDRVFRNESLDATHLAEFHQFEGVIADRNIGLPQLKAIIKEFFNKIGITDLRFKPTYNPYTEPSMEVYGYHPILRKWVEIGNSGVFRPEMLRPMGLPEDVGVLGWGLSLERPTMIQYKVSNIRDLLGYNVSVKYVKNNPICCFSK
jgi:phenylalanyl-tRNA synthetase alpha chain